VSVRKVVKVDESTEFPEQTDPRMICDVRLPVRVGSSRRCRIDSWRKNRSKIGSLRNIWDVRESLTRDDSSKSTLVKLQSFDERRISPPLIRYEW